MPEKAKQSFLTGLDILTSNEVLLKGKDEKPKTEYDIFLTFEGEEPQAFYRQ
jgi:hypothetical protein